MQSHTFHFNSLPRVEGDERMERNPDGSYISIHSLAYEESKNSKFHSVYIDSQLYITLEMYPCSGGTDTGIRRYDTASPKQEYLT